MSEKRIAVTTGLRWGGEVLSKGIWFVFIIVLARILGAEDFGNFNYAFSLASMLVVFTDLGTNINLIKAISSNGSSNEDYVNSTIYLKILLSIGVIIAAVLAAARSSQPLFVIFITVSLVIAAFIDPINYFFRAKKQIHYESITLLILRGAIVAAVLGSLYFLKVRLQGVSIAFICASVFALLAANGIIKRTHGLNLRLDINSRKYWKEILRGSIPIGLVLIFGTLFFKLNVVVLQHFRGAQEVGLYSAAFKLIEGMFFISSLFIGAIFPYLCESNEDGKISKTNIALFGKAAMFLLAISATIALILSFSSPTIIQILYGTGFIGSQMTLKLLAWSLVLIFVNEVFLYLFLGMNRQKLVAGIMGITTVIYLVLCFWLIPIQGHIGAAWALIGAQVTLLTLNAIQFKRLA